VIAQFLKDKINMLNMLVSLYSEEFFSHKINVETLFLAMNSKGDIVDLQVIDVTGTQHAYVGPYRAKIAGKKYDDAPWFRETLISGVHVSDVFTGYSCRACVVWVSLWMLCYGTVHARLKCIHFSQKR